MDNTIINLQPIISTPEDKPIINSFYLYIFAIFEFIVILLILYYFFYIEIKFLYNMVFKKNVYSVTDKKLYNNFMEQFKKLVENNKRCILRNKIYYPTYTFNNYNNDMTTLNDTKISFPTIEQCNNFLNL